MKMFFLLFIFATTNLIVATVPDLSGLYDFEACACTVLNCPDSYLFRLNQTPNDNFIISIRSNISAAVGKTTSTDDGQQTRLSMQWLPGVDFDTSCNGLWIPSKRTIELNCGDQYRHCTGRLKCRDNSGPCAKNNSYSIHIQYACWNSIIGLLLLLLIKNSFL